MISYIKKVTKMFYYLKGYLKYQLLIFIVGLAYTLMNANLPLFRSRIIDQALAAKDLNLLIISVAKYFCFLLLIDAVFMVKDYSEALVGSLVKAKIRINILKSILRTKYYQVTKMDPGITAETISRDVQEFSDRIFSKVIFQLAYSVVYVIYISFLLSKINYIFIFVILALTPVRCLANRLFFSNILDKKREVRDIFSTTVFEFTKEVLSNIKLFKIFGSTSFLSRKFVDNNNKLIKALLGYRKTSYCYKLVIRLVSLVDDAFFIFVLVYFLFNKMITIGDFTALIAYKKLLLSNIDFILDFKIELASELISIDRISELVSKDKEPICFRTATFNSRIVFENVSFGYTPEFPIIKNFNFVINKGDKVVITGKNGSGKTTFINLLLRLCSPYKGGIFMDNVNIESTNLYRYLKMIGVVTQENMFFKGTLRENILLGRKANESELKKICEICEIDKSLEYVIEIAATNLSSGEQQRIIIARALIGDPEIIIFDEPEVFLDNELLLKIKHIMKTELSNRTVILVSHAADMFIDNCNRQLKL